MLGLLITIVLSKRWVLGSVQFVEENYHRDGHLLVSCGCRYSTVTFQYNTVQYCTYYTVHYCTVLLHYCTVLYCRDNTDHKNSVMAFSETAARW